MNENELQHYGVLGMKWGIQKNPERAYTKSKTKSVKLKTKSTKADLKLSKTNKKLDKYHRKSKKVSEGEDNPYTEKIKRLEGISEKRANKARNLKQKHKKWADAMDKNFGKLDIDSLPKEDVEAGKEYVNYILALQSEKVSRRYISAIR